jgi:hypothetical protein
MWASLLLIPYILWTKKMLMLTAALQTHKTLGLALRGLRQKGNSEGEGSSGQRRN